MIGKIVPLLAHSFPRSVVVVIASVIDMDVKCEWFLLIF